MRLTVFTLSCLGFAVVTGAALAQGQGTIRGRGQGASPRVNRPAAARPATTRPSVSRPSANRPATPNSLRGQSNRSGLQQAHPFSEPGSQRNNNRRPLFSRRPQQTEETGSALPFRKSHPVQSRRPVAADRVLQNRLAVIDQLRDRALESGNLELLEQADKLERIVRTQHARMGGTPPEAPTAPTPPPEQPVIEEPAEPVQN